MHEHTHTHTAVCQPGDLRLAGGSSDFEGRVELCVDETWTSVCADGAWTNLDANVACRQAGYSATGTSQNYINFSLVHMIIKIHKHQYSHKC